MAPGLASCVPRTGSPGTGSPLRRRRRRPERNPPGAAAVDLPREPTVTDAPDADRYELRDGDRLLGIAAYRRRGDVVVFTHTEVNPDEGRSGLGGTLVRSALDDVRSRGGKVVPLCPFVRGWIERHPDYADLVLHES